MEPAPQKKDWTVEISIDEHRKRTRARARLRWRGRHLTGIGIARVNPSDRNIPEIGDELAVARALSNLADELFAATAYDIHTATDEPVVLVH
jgi:hypothetical protein